MDENPYQPPGAEIATAPAPSSGELVYAGFWRRLSAFWLDALVLLPLMGLTFWLGGIWRLFHVFYAVPGLLFGLWFYVHLVKRYGGTPGKLLMGIRIARLDGASVGYKEAMIRYSVWIAFSVVGTAATVIAALSMTDADYLSLGFLGANAMLVDSMPGWYRPVPMLANIWVWSEFIVMMTNRQRRSLQDYMAGTIVVRKSLPGGPVVL